MPGPDCECGGLEAREGGRGDRDAAGGERAGEAWQRRGQGQSFCGRVAESSGAVALPGKVSCCLRCQTRSRTAGNVMVFVLKGGVGLGLAVFARGMQRVTLMWCVADQPEEMDAHEAGEVAG
eukprot:3937797-Rhodomonas_salina.1